MIPSEDRITRVIQTYHRSFAGKVYGEKNDEHDVIMDIFGLVPAVNRENRQYWGRELGMGWQLIVTELFRATVEDFKPGYREGGDELCDLIASRDATGSIRSF